MIGPEFPEDVPTRVPERTLRQFAGLCLVICGGLFALSWYRHQRAPNLAGWVAGALAVLIGMPGLTRPNMIRPVYLGAMALTKPIGHVVGLGLLAVVYYGVLTPLALTFRLAGRDGLGRFRRRSESYWIDHLPTVDVRLYLRQYQQQVAVGPASAAGSQAPASARSAAPASVAELSEPHFPARPGASHGSP